MYSDEDDDIEWYFRSKLTIPVGQTLTKLDTKMFTLLNLRPARVGHITDPHI